ncbi:hypothetical protein ACEQ8H_004495 [Pleosporales sp. CAS-2024a]
MGTLTADCPRLDEHCPHKLATSCRLTSTPNCCACADGRAHSRTYRVYIDGIGFVQRGTRWQGYCWFCKEFWTNRLAATEPALETSQTRIPEIPDQTEFLERWFEFHQGYRVAKLPDGTEQRVPVVGEPFKEVSPGFLPRTLDQLRQGVANDARRPENRLRRRRLTSEEERPEEPQQSLDSALDRLLAEVEDEDTPRASHEPAVQVDEAAQEPTAQLPSSIASQPQELAANESSQPSNRSRPTNRGEASLQRARERFARVFGTAEDIQQEDYESPLSTLYNRAENRYNQAEVRRATNTTSPPSLDGLSARERREIEEQLLWGVMRESALEGEPENSVWSYAPRRRQPAGFLSTHNMQHHRTQQAQGYNRIPVRPSTNAERDQNTSFASSSSQATPERSLTSTINGSSADEEMNPTGLTMLRRHQVRYEALLADRMAEWERVGSEPRTEGSTSQQREDNVRAGRESTAQSATPPSNASLHGMSQIQASIQQITAELQRLRVASEAITSARHSMHSHIQPTPDRPLQTLDNQPGRPPAMSDEDMTKKLECQVCYQQLANIALLPCGHMVMCQWCADVVIPVKHSHLPIRSSKCPMCRKAVKQRFRIHM